MLTKPPGKEKFKAPLKGTPKHIRPPSPHRLYLVMALVTVVFLVGGYLFYHLQEQQMHQRIESGLSIVAQLKVEQIAQWRAERLNDADMLAGSPFFTEGVAKYMASPTDTETKDEVLTNLAIIGKFYPYQDIVLVDVNGSVLLSLNDSVHRLSDMALAQLAVAIKEHKAVFTDFHYPPDSNSPHLDVIAPLFPWQQDSQPAIGAVVLSIDPSQYLYPLVQSWPFPSETAETLLVERDGDQVLFLNESRHQKDTALKLRIPLSQQEVPAVMAVLGKEGVVEGRDYRGVETLAALKHIPDSPWYMVAKIDTSEALAAWRFRAGMILVFMAGLLAAALAGTGLIWQRRQTLAYQALYQAEIEAQALRRHFEYLVKYANDIILLVDENHTIVEANDRALETYGYTREEMLGLPLAALIPPGDLPSHQARLRKIQQKGAIVAEAIQQRKNGSTFPVEVSGRAIKIEDKPYFQEIIRDITERKQAEEALKHLNLTLRAIRNVNQLISHEKDRNRLLEGICRCVAEGRGYQGAWVAVLDESSKLVTHAQVGFGRSLLPIVEQLKQGILPRCGQQAMRQSEVAVIAEQCSTCGGCPLSGGASGKAALTVRLEHSNTVYGLLSAMIPPYFITDEEMGLFRELANDCAFALYDIDLQDKHKAAEESLLLSEQNFRDSMENSPLGIRIVGEDGKILYANRALLDIYGYGNLEELEAVPSKQRYTPESYVEHRGRVKKRKLGEYVPPSYEISIVRKDGDVRHLAVSRGEVLWDGEKQFQVVYQDITERKQTEEALRQSEGKYRTILKEIEDSYFEVDLAGNLTFFNDSTSNSLGYSAEELIGMSYREFTVSEDIELVYKAFNKVYQTNRPNKGFLWKVARKDGTLGFVEATVSPLRNPKGEIIGFRGVGRDITERKQAEDMLKVSQERYRTLVESANETICVIQDGAIKFANPRAAELSGYSLEKPIPFIELVHPDDREMLISRYLKRLEGEEIPSIYPFRIIDKEGDTKWVELNSARITWGGNPAVLVLLTDITDRKQAEVALQREKLLGDSIVENTPAGIAFLDNDFVLRKCNSVYADLIRTYTPYTPEQALGMSYYDYAPGSRPQVEGWFQKVRDTGQADTRYGFGLVLQKDGQELATYWDTSVAPVLNVAGKVEGILILTQDVTEHKRQEEERKQLELKAQVTSRLASVGEMAAGVAHEINNPLTGVIGYAQLLMDREDIPKDIRRDLAAINDGAQRVAGIVKRLLAFSRQTKPERRYVDINELIESTLALRDYHLKVNNIKVTTQLAPDLPKTVADPGQLQQVLLNLIVNAETEMKLAHGKGKLAITTEKSDNTIKICFKDDGPGIKPEIIDRIFDPFFTTREVGQGTGLGLSLCYGIITEHNGKIYAESKLGKGATFVVELPVVAEAEPSKPPEPVVEEPEKVAKAKILVVDDEKVIRDLVKRVLAEEGYEVDTVDNAAEALKMIESQRYNLILLDIKMPGMDGVELYKRIQKIAKSLARRVVFITGDILGAHTEKFLSETKVAHIDKPFNAEQLRREVKRVLTGGR